MAIRLIQRCGVVDHDDSGIKMFLLDGIEVSNEVSNKISNKAFKYLIMA